MTCKLSSIPWLERARLLSSEIERQYCNVLDIRNEDLASIRFPQTDRKFSSPVVYLETCPLVFHGVGNKVPNDRNLFRDIGSLVIQSEERKSS